MGCGLKWEEKGRGDWKGVLGVPPFAGAALGGIGEAFIVFAVLL